MPNKWIAEIATEIKTREKKELILVDAKNQERQLYKELSESLWSKIKLAVKEAVTEYNSLMSADKKLKLYHLVKDPFKMVVGRADRKSSHGITFFITQRKIVAGTVTLPVELSESETSLEVLGDHGPLDDESLTEHLLFSYLSQQ